MPPFPLSEPRWMGPFAERFARVIEQLKQQEEAERGPDEEDGEEDGNE